MERGEPISDGFEIDFDDDDLNDLSLKNHNKSVTIDVPIEVKTKSMRNGISSHGLRKPIGSSSKENGPQLYHKTASNWILGVKNFSLSSDRLNERMAGRGILISNSNDCLISQQKHQWNASRRIFPNDVNMKVIPITAGPFPLEDIEESNEYFDTFHSHMRDSDRFNDELSSKREPHIRFNMDTVSQQLMNSEISNNPFEGNNKKLFLNDDRSSSTEEVNKKSTSMPLNSNRDVPKEIECRDDNGTRTKFSDNIRPQKIVNTNPSHRKVTYQSTDEHLNEQTSQSLSTNYKRSVNQVTLTPKQELQRYRRQCFCESASLIIIIISVIFVTITPFLLIPIWVIPNEYSPLIQNLLWVSLGMSVLFLTLASLIGNVYWYYDPRSGKWKWFYHCGTGPSDHYWGATILHHKLPTHKKNKHQIMSINV